MQRRQHTWLFEADKVVQERYERLVLGLRALEAAKLQEWGSRVQVTNGHGTTHRSIDELHT